MEQVVKVLSIGSEEEILGSTCEEVKPQDIDMGKWCHKLSSRAEILKYLKSGQRYFYSDDWFGSEKRKTPA